MQQAFRPGKQVADLVVRAGNKGVVLSGSEHALQVHIRESEGQRPAASHLGKGEVAADRQIPSLVDHLAGRAEEPASKRVIPELEAAPQLLRLQRRDRHPLAVQRIEACDGVTDDQQAGWETPQPLVAPTPVRREGMADQLSEPLTLADRGEYIGRGHRSKKVQQLLLASRRVVICTVA